MRTTPLRRSREVARDDGRTLRRVIATATSAYATRDERGGFISRRAWLVSGAWVADDARVCDRATIIAALIDSDACVSGTSTVAGGIVTGDGRVTGDSRLIETVVYGGSISSSTLTECTVSGTPYIVNSGLRYACVGGTARVADVRAFGGRVDGDALVHGARVPAGAHISDGAYVMSDDDVVVLGIIDRHTVTAYTTRRGAAVTWRGRVLQDLPAGASDRMRETFAEMLVRA